MYAKQYFSLKFYVPFKRISVHTSEIDVEAKTGVSREKTPGTLEIKTYLGLSQMGPVLDWNPQTVNTQNVRVRIKSDATFSN